MNKIPASTWIIFALIVIVIGMALFSIDRNEFVESQRIQLERDQKRLKVKEDSLVKASRQLSEASQAAIKMMQQKDLEARDAVAKADKYKAKYDQILFRTTRTDRERDSLIRSIVHN